MKLNYLKSKRNKIIASVLTSAMVLNLFPKGLFSVLSSLFETKVRAEGVDMTESVSFLVNYADAQVPDYGSISTQ